jgi:hypothetical protein
MYSEAAAEIKAELADMEDEEGTSNPASRD